MQMCRESLKKVRFAGIRTLTPGLIFFKGPFWGAYIGRGLSTGGNLRFKIDWANLVVGRKFTVFAFFFTLYLRAISKYKPLGGLYLEGRFNGGFFALRVWGAYIWRDLFSKFYWIFRLSFHICISCVLYREVQIYEILVQSNTALRKPRYYGQFALPSGK